MKTLSLKLWYTSLRLMSSKPLVHLNLCEGECSWAGCGSWNLEGLGHSVKEGLTCYRLMEKKFILDIDHVNNRRKSLWEDWVWAAADSGSCMGLGPRDSVQASCSPKELLINSWHHFWAPWAHATVGLAWATLAPNMLSHGQVPDGCFQVDWGLHSGAWIAFLWEGVLKRLSPLGPLNIPSHRGKSVSLKDSVLQSRNKM